MVFFLGWGIHFEEFWFDSNYSHNFAIILAISIKLQITLERRFIKTSEVRKTKKLRKVKNEQKYEVRIIICAIGNISENGQID